VPTKHTADGSLVVILILEGFALIHGWRLLLLVLRIL
jgi:hypothetical protein